MDTPLLDWETVGEVANMAQLMRLDAVSLIVLIIKAASTAQILKRRCRHFAEHLKFIRDLLEELKSAPLMEHPDTGGPLTRLEDVLRKSYVLVNYCQERCYLTLLMVGCSISIKLKKAQEEIDYFLKIIPLVALVDNRRFKAAHMQSPSDELVDFADYNSMLKFQARHVVEQMEPELWAKVLTPENPFRRQLIDQVISTTLPMSKNPDQVSATVKAFMTADLSHELIELLEKIVLQHSAFSGNPNLQNLLIRTAIRVDKSRVMHYINRFDNLDDPTIGETAVRAEMYEEAFALFQKSNLNVQAVNVLLDNIGSIVRAVQFASRVQEDAVHSQVAKAQFREGLVSNAIESFIRADDATWFPDVIRVAEQASVYHDLVKYLLMVRKKVKETKVDSELIYAYAKIDKPGEIEEFILTDNVANLRSVGDRLFDEALYEAAKITFSFISNWAKLAITLVKLRQFQEAVDAAHRADSLKTWKKVCFACVDAEEFKLAQICGLKITGQVDDWNEVCDYYRQRDHYVELISLFESCPGLERQHKRARYLRDKFMKHIKLWQSN